MGLTFGHCTKEEGKMASMCGYTKLNTTTTYLHTLFPHKIKTPKFYDLSMLDKVSKVELV